MSPERIVLLLGRRDEPTDGVADYCHYLGKALVPLGYAVDVVHVPWAERGWRASLKELRENASDWRGYWVLLQYTALSWSRRGFPLRVLRVLHILAQSGARIGIVFHDASPFPGTRLLDTLRRRCQVMVMRRAYAVAERVFLTIPAEKNSWLPAQSSKDVFIPVGANQPETPLNTSHRQEGGAPLTVAVYGITGGAQMRPEMQDIVFVMNRAAAHLPDLRLLVFGRNAMEAKEALVQALHGTRVALEVRGILPPEEVAATLARSDLLLFVRGHISSRRGSAIAGIACGLPVVGYQGPETAWPITDAGVSLAPAGDREALAMAVEQVLLDDSFRRTLAERSRRAHREYFSWPAIARRYAGALRNPDEQR